MQHRTRKQIRQWLSNYIPSWVLLQHVSQIQRIISTYATHLSTDTTNKLKELKENAESLANQIKENSQNPNTLL